jgi:hypothetical protein
MYNSLTVNMFTFVSWVATLCGLVGTYQCFWETYGLHLQPWRWKYYHSDNIIIVTTLMMEAANSPEKLVSIYETTRSTERLCRVVNTPASYSGDHGFILRPGDRSSWSLFVVFPSHSRRIPGQHLKIKTRQLPIKSFPIHHHSVVVLSPTVYSLVTEKASLNKPPNYLPDKCWDGTLKLGHDRFLSHPSNPSQFIIYSSLHNSTLYCLSYWEIVFKQT